MLYAIQVEDGGPVKIGKGRNPRSRLMGLQVASPYKLRLLAECNWHDQNETILHDHLRESYIRGEWFEPSEEVMKIVAFMRADDFAGVCKRIGRLYEMPRFDKKKYQREYMRLRRGRSKADQPTERLEA